MKMVKIRRGDFWPHPSKDARIAQIVVVVVVVVVIHLAGSFRFLIP